MAKLSELKKKIKRYQENDELRNLIFRPVISDELYHLQRYVINAFVEVDRLMGEMIRAKILSHYGNKSQLETVRLFSLVRDSIEYIPYKQKNKILKKHEQKFQSLFQRIKKLEEIRILFAHSDLRKLQNEYDISTLSGAQKILSKFEFIYKLTKDIVEAGLNVQEYKDYVKKLQVLTGNK